MSRALILTATLLIALPAAAQTFELPTTSAAKWKILQMQLAGRELNGTGLFGDELEGRTLVGADLDGVVVGRHVIDAELEATRFSGRGLRGKGRVVGALFTGLLDDGGEVLLRVDGVERREERWLRDTLQYEVSYETANGWMPLCGLDDEGAPIPAIPLNGQWDHNEGSATGGAHLDDARRFTFACTGFVLAHCVEAGYKPWVVAQVCDAEGACEEISMAEHHQACTRMMRADYCGDGTPHTEDGVFINVYDAFGIRVDEDDWSLEAEWTPDGAACLARTRLPDHVPSCYEALLDAECGQDPEWFESETLLVNEVAE